MENHKLTIIIPCYNSSATLEEALTSVYQQNIKIPFEVVMVDDGSTDDTRELMLELSKKYQYVKCYFHKKNRGGGAARNTAIERAEGDLIFCLDSDDMLTPGMLNRMVAFMDEKKCDGVGISKSIKFKKKDVNDVAFITDFGYVGKKILFASLFEGSACPLYSTFLHTKDAFHIAGGYPTGHGFDTQGFAFRFLANGLTAYACPDATYLHRVNFHRSYYIREYEAGKASRNWLKIYEEFLYLFKDEVKNKILAYDLNDHARPLSDFVNSIPDRFSPNYQNYLKPHAKDLYREVALKNKSAYQLYWLGNESYEADQFTEASKFFTGSILEGVNCDLVYYKAFDSLAKVNGHDFEELKMRIERLNQFKYLGRMLPLYKRGLNKIRKISNLLCKNILK